MIKLRAYPIAIVSLFLVSCVAPDVTQDHSQGLIESDIGGAPGYQHALERSLFETGATTAALRRVEEHGFAKVIGPDGVFATSLSNGLVVAIQNGSRDKVDAEARAAGVAAPFVMEPDEHNTAVVNYFLAAGVPKEQLGSVHANTYLSSVGSASEARPAPPRVDGYASILERKIGKYAVVDSVAWARLNEEGKVIGEWVYWPAIPAKALADARRLEALVEGRGPSDYLARLPAGLAGGKVVIRHSSATAEGPFEAFASYDVLERKTSDIVDEKTQNGRIAGSVVSAVVRHFDVDGVERLLPQERRKMSADHPPKSNQP